MFLFGFLLDANANPHPKSWAARLKTHELQMPNVNGLDFLEDLMGKGCRKPQFAMTSGQWTEAAVERARQLGCKVFLKPFHISDIIQWLEEVEPLIVPDRQLLNWYEQEWRAKKADSSGQK